MDTRFLPQDMSTELLGLVVVTVGRKAACVEGEKNRDNLELRPLENLAGLAESASADGRMLDGSCFLRGRFADGQLVAPWEVRAMSVLLWD